jgi:TolB protein
LQSVLKPVVILTAITLAAVVAAAARPADSTFPGRKGKIAFVRVGVIYTINSDGSGLRRLTRGIKAEYPAWSPNGRMIAFSGACNIYVMRADGRRVRRLSRRPWRPGQLCATQPAWSPNGARIAFVKRRRSASRTYGAVYVMSAAGTAVRALSQRRLTTASPEDAFPAWSPDGTKIAFARDTHTGELPEPAVYVMNANGTGQVRLRPRGSDPPLMESMPDWSPDGERIAIGTARLVRGQGGDQVMTSFIVVMTPSGDRQTNVTRVVENDVGDRFPAWSPDGSSIAYESNGIGVMASDGSERKRLTRNGRDESPDWQPLR